MQFGSGVQIFATCLVTLVLASAGFLSPASRGALLTGAVVLFLLLAVTSGYSAVLLWINNNSSFEGWTSICLQTACYVPGVPLGCYGFWYRSSLSFTQAVAYTRSGASY